MSEFFYENPFPILKDTTEYKKISSDYVKTVTYGNREILEIDPKDSAIEIYLKRSEHFEKYGVPPDWEGLEKLDLK